ncbi:MAG: RNA pseudouridine synthase [Bdellovibrio sp. CG12_big_fil_rev_8_21_14_0_65_39_13]|nr:MAG: RNA pseudouridine synthase [Bdellovibrio sp. CG22_combo_CG10-13_8_21_14_all_39_27]PIQ58144.1 MAG: RNA pseudouridine synthase [Bdellovibrio sp. CG12_big_fil_rev_8_21_14_0_65_39_13]PIR34306.1 MAG: RNA pseudouridine synthase [Bdellovibrio sp. CG11_big_fil_rev_8_21_14_0_20_39_38]
MSEESLGEESRIFTITQKDRDDFKRLDQYLNHKIEEYSRNFLKNLFDNDLIELNSDSPNPHIKLELKKMPPEGTIVQVNIPPPLPAEAEAENIPLEILYEDEHLVFVNKPAGMVTHPAPGNYRGTLVNAILYHCKDLKGVGDQKRPGIVHRLDKGTSGVMVVAKNQKCHELLVGLFSKHDLERRYQALAINRPQATAGHLESMIGRHPQNRLKMTTQLTRGKQAITDYKVLELFHKACLLEMKLETGRTHQIRVHLKELLKTPIINDPLYGHPNDDKRILGAAATVAIGNYEHPYLHAKVLGFIHPMTQQPMHFESPLPPEFQQLLDVLRGES